MRLYKTPFSKAYWKDSLKTFHSLRCIAFAAMMIAVCIVLSLAGVKIVLAPNLTFSFGFLPRALCSLVCGPVGAMVFAVAEDTLSFFISSSAYGYFPGYALTTMLGCLWYALFLYRARVTVARIALVKLLNNIQNVFLGSLWSAILTSHGYLYHMTNSALKNIVCLPLEILVLTVMLQCLLPVLKRMGIVPNQLGDTGRIKLF